MGNPQVHLLASLPFVKCVVDGCVNHRRVWRGQYYSRFCTTHTSRRQRHGGTEAYAKKSGVRPRWNGKGWLSENGYLRVDFYGVETYVHRLVYLIEHGELPPKGWHVHHEDGDTLNNHPSNLVALPGNEHLALHRKG